VGQPFRVADQSYPDSTSVNYTYDILGRLTQAADASGTYSFSYDNLGRLTQTSTQYAFLSGQTLGGWASLWVVRVRGGWHTLSRLFE
jgi:YD repeat-containing protein